MIIALNGAIHPIAGVIYVLWILFAAIYSGHHWVSDCLGGLLIAILSDYLAKLYVRTLTFEVVELEVEVEVNALPNLQTFNEIGMESSGVNVWVLFWPISQININIYWIVNQYDGG